MATRNIIIAPCGNRSYLFKEQWLNQKQQKQFDVCLLFYHEQINKPELYAEVEYFFHLKDFKYHMIYELLTNLHPQWLQQYEYFYFLDDDIEIDTLQINQMFLLSRAFNSFISQASLTKDSYCSWPMFKQQRKSFCRFVGQIEVMAPLFNANALQKCLPSFIGNRSSWGVDSVWSKILKYPEDKLIVFDKITMRHTQPVGGGELYQKIGIDPQQDWKNIVNKYDARKQNYREYGRLQLINKRSNRAQFFLYKLKEFFMKRKQAWNDYDVNSRIISQRNKLIKKIKK
ncbi:MAG: hypothetical protein ACR2FN_06775 [Chitinophagaceae bacterium]